MKSLKHLMAPSLSFTKRYIDNILGATSVSRENRDRFINFVSNLHPIYSVGCENTANIMFAVYFGFKTIEDMLL